MKRTKTDAFCCNGMITESVKELVGWTHNDGEIN